MANSTKTHLRFNIPKSFSSAYHFSHTSRLSKLIILNLFYLKLNHYLFHLARHHQKKVIVMIVMLILKVSPGKFFLQCAKQLHMFIFCIKGLLWWEKKIPITCTQKWKRKKTGKANKVSNYWNIKRCKLFHFYVI